MKQFTLTIILAIILQFANAQSWLLTGNSGTNSSTNFLGTKDANALSFRVNNQQAGHIDYSTSKANTSFGFQTLKNLTGNNNAAFGFRASYSNTSGIFNASFGSYALFNNTSGYSNVAVGAGALYKNKSGKNLVAVGDSSLYNAVPGFGANTAVGSKALYATTTGSSNTANGYQSLYSNNTGYNNTGSGVSALYSNTSGNNNSAFGYGALPSNTTGSFNTATGGLSLDANTTGSHNTANGYYSLFFNQTGNNNTATGYQSLYFNKASNLTATGYQALYSNSTGGFNVATGSYAMYFNSTGQSNAAYGYSSLYYNTTGSDNTASGTLSLYANTTGSSNNAHGHYAMYNNSTGSYNVAVGDDALYTNTFGSYNTAVGIDALYPNNGAYYNTAVGFLALGYAGLPGYNNVAVGAFSGPDVNTYAVFNSIAVGEACYTTASNQARIGNASTTSIGGYVDWSNISDRRVKQNIKQNVPGLAFINKLNPVTYNLSMDAINRFIPDVKKDKDGKTLPAISEEITSRKEKEQIVYTGFVAQDVEKAAKSLNFDFSGVDAPKNDKDLYGLRYAEFVVPLVKAVQELSKMNDDKDTKIDALQKQNDELEKRLEKLEAMMNVQQSTSNIQLRIFNISSASLEQNIPNPFNHTTTINYTLPQTYSSAKIIITDKSAKTLKEVNLSGNGKGSLKVDASGLANGAYQYSLYVDEKLIATKQMILEK